MSIPSVVVSSQLEVDCGLAKAKTSKEIENNFKIKGR